MTPDLVVYHTNDFHNRVTPAQLDALRALRAKGGARALLLDAGDAVSSGNITYHRDGEPILDAMSDAGYDAMVVGNREFHVTRAGFSAKVGRARFPVLCANVRAKRSGTPLPVVASMERVLGDGIRVAVFGVTVPMVTERMRAQHLSAYVFDDPLTTAVALHDRLRAKCDVLICLSHAGLAVDERIAASAPGIDLIVGGHTHAELREGRRVGGTMIVQAGAHGRLVGRVTIDITEGRPALTANLQEL